MWFAINSLLSASSEQDTLYVKAEVIIVVAGTLIHSQSDATVLICTLVFVKGEPREASRRDPAEDWLFTYNTVGPASLH